MIRRLGARSFETPLPQLNTKASGNINDSRIIPHQVDSFLQTPIKRCLPPSLPLTDPGRKPPPRHLLRGVAQSLQNPTRHAQPFPSPHSSGRRKSLHRNGLFCRLCSWLWGCLDGCWGFGGILVCMFIAHGGGRI